MSTKTSAVPVPPEAGATETQNQFAVFGVENRFAVLGVDVDLKPN